MKLYRYPHLCSNYEKSRKSRSVVAGFSHLDMSSLICTWPLLLTLGALRSLHPIRCLWSLLSTMLAFLLLILQLILESRTVAHHRTAYLYRRREIPGVISTSRPGELCNDPPCARPRV